MKTLTKQFMCMVILMTALSGCDQPTTKLSEAQIAEQDRQQVSDLLDEVRHREKSFESAGCDYRGGEWDVERSICVREFMISRSEGETSQDEVLASRIKILAELSHDHANAEAEAQNAATSWLDDHPRDYRGAIGHAIAAVRRRGLLAGLPKAKAQQLPQLTDGSFKQFIDLSRIP
jgi:hypothetical protein